MPISQKINNLTPNSFYSFLSDDYIQFNVHLNNSSNADEIGIQIGETKIHGIATQDEITVDGIKLYQYTYFPLGLSDYIGFAEMRFDHNLSPFTADNLLSTVFIEAGKYNFNINRYMRRGAEQPFYYDILTMIINKNVTPTGIISENDCKIENIWSNNFELNRFQKEVVS